MPIAFADGFWRVMGERAPAPPPPPVLEVQMISLYPPPIEEMEKGLRTSVREWIMRQCAGEKYNWIPGLCVTLWAEGRPRLLSNGVWEVSGSTLYVGNSPPRKAPLWAPAALMAVARSFDLDKEVAIVQSIHKMLAGLMMDVIRPVALFTAEAHNGKKITYIAVNEKEQLVAGLVPDGDGVWRLLSGERVEPGEGWVKLQM